MDLERNKTNLTTFEQGTIEPGEPKTVQPGKSINQEIDPLNKAIENQLSEFKRTDANAELDIHVIDPKAGFDKSELSQLSDIRNQAEIETLKAAQSLHAIKDKSALATDVEQNVAAKNKIEASPILDFFRQQEQKISGDEYRSLEWKQENLDVYKALTSTKGPFVEIGGPTIEGFEQVDIKALDGKFFVSNIESAIPKFDGSANKVGMEKVDLQVDARILPFKDSTIGAVFASNLGSSKYNKEIINTGELRRQAIKEAGRVLKNNGLLIWEGGRTEDFVYADEAGFQLIQFKLEMNPNNAPRYNCVLKKLPAKPRL